MRIEHNVVNESPNSLMTCLLPELRSWPWSPVKLFASVSIPTSVGESPGSPQHRATARPLFLCLWTLAALRLCEDSLLGPCRLRCSFIDCTAVNLPNISAAPACTHGWSRRPLTGDLNVFVYWSPNTTKPVLNHVVPTCPGDTEGIYSNETTVLVCFPYLFCCLYAVHSWCKIQSPHFSPS